MERRRTKPDQTNQRAARGRPDRPNRVFSLSNRIRWSVSLL